MTTQTDLFDFATRKDYKFIIAADGEPVVHKTVGSRIIPTTAAGGVSTAFDPIAKATKATFIARAKTPEDLVVADKNGIFNVEDKYRLKRINVSELEMKDYYDGFANQTLWPLSHVAFERPKFDEEWFTGFKKVNERFAKAIKDEIKGKTFIWVNDYQLSLVPAYLNRPKNTIVAFFWHIPWPTWETFRIMPQKKELLDSLLSSDFIAFHRGYQARNFIETVKREVEARIDEEKKQIHYRGKVTTVTNLPMGIDYDVITAKLNDEAKDSPFITNIVNNILGVKQKEEGVLSDYFKKYKVILGVDRIDYTKGLILRLLALERFLDDNKKYIGKVIYLGIMAPSRLSLPAYREVEKNTIRLSNRINQRFGTRDWKPIHLIEDTFSREDVIKCYERASVCLVTPRDDGMNLVSKEFVASSSKSDNPGVLVLSEFAGSAIDLSEALIVNPYDFKEVATAIKTGLEMSKKERKERIREMAQTLEENNVYEWALNFFKGAIASKVK